ncbi:hypothetical protein NMY22_g14075 [Coprinellus aureogranulatus]|nr:hypothetical protein NMY22_g14075 [Coprinellus aureogranulatus]
MAHYNRNFNRQSARSTYSNASLRSTGNSAIVPPNEKGALLSRIHSQSSVKVRAPALRSEGCIDETARRSGPPELHWRAVCRACSQFSLDASPRTWGTPLDMRTPEPDDDLHNPNPARDRKWDTRGSVLTKRGVLNLGCLTVLTVGLLMLFGGYPMITHITRIVQTNQGGFNLGGINGTGQVPDIAGNYGLIDKDTPKEAHKRKSHETGEEMVLVFSDEFNVDGRSFYPGDDPYWEAVDLWYWGTRDLEWYDPAQVTTKDGALQITLDKTDLTDASLKHNLTYKSGMLQSWNKFCFTGGYIEGEKLQVGQLFGFLKFGPLQPLSGSQDEATSGLWPAVWTLGNLGRAGYGATLDGLWPYSYDSCDIGTLPNQTYADQTGPPAALQNGDPEHDGVLSFRPGQRLSACTCPGESHPGPMKKNGDYVGRAAPEIDILEGIVEETVLRGQVSQSSQWAPYNARYQWKKSSSTYKIYDTDNTELNSYAGSVNQQAVSGLAFTNSSCYELGGGCFTTYGFEYTPGYDDAYVAWVNNGKPSWTHYARGLDADAEAEISRRPISQEPMYIIANLGISRGFGVISEALTFPAVMSIDYIRVYQPADKMQISCDPEDYPTKAYIDTYREAYTNPQLTSWKEDYKQPWPKNKLTTEGCSHPAHRASVISHSDINGPRHPCWALLTHFFFLLRSGKLKFATLVACALQSSFPRISPPVAEDMWTHNCGNMRVGREIIPDARFSSALGGVPHHRVGKGSLAMLPSFPLRLSLRFLELL